MKIRAAVLNSIGLPRPYAISKPLTITELILDRPGQGEVLVKVAAAGLCHSDLSVINGDRPRPLPMALGHGAAVRGVARRAQRPIPRAHCSPDVAISSAMARPSIITSVSRLLPTMPSSPGGR